MNDVRSLIQYSVTLGLIAVFITLGVNPWLSLLLVAALMFSFFTAKEVLAAKRGGVGSAPRSLDGSHERIDN